MRQVVTQSNGSQGSKTYGPRTTDHQTASRMPDNAQERTLRLQLDGDLVPAQAFDANDDTQWALPAGCFITECWAYSDTGATVNVGVMDEDMNGGNTNIAAGLAVPGANWAVVRDIDLATGARSQVEFTIGAGERAVVWVKYVYASHLSDDNGVLRRPV